MSHSHERKEKVCLNCGSALFGRYCHVCGQENIEPKETMLGLITHFFHDITHFDGKFFSTLKLLLTRPGFLSREYNRGRRASFLHPIRMYVFTSAVFFLIFFSIFHIGNTSETDNALATDASFAKLVRERQSSRRETSKEDSIALARVNNLLGSGATVKITSPEDSLAFRRVKDLLGFAGGEPGSDTAKVHRVTPYISFSTNNVKSKQAYDSAQRQLPQAKRDGWFRKIRVYKQIEINEKIQKDPKGFFYTWLSKLMHLFPQLLFVSLPIFAFILQLLYVRHKRYYYANHGIFAIHLYIFTFIALLIYFMVVKLQEGLGWGWLSFINYFLWLYILVYTYKAMRNYYGQGWFKTFVKYCLLGLMSSIVILFLFVIFFMFSIFQI